MKLRLLQGWRFNLWLRSGGYGVLCGGTSQSKKSRKGCETNDLERHDLISAKGMLFKVRRYPLRVFLTIGSLAALLALSACSGTMQGVTRGTGEAVQFSYEQGMNSDTLTAVIGSETFKGKAVPRGRQSIQATNWTGASVYGSSSTGEFMAVLLGSRGSSLSCQLQYASAEGLTTSGGVGVCQHSDGRVIDVVW